MASAMVRLRHLLASRLGQNILANYLGVIWLGLLSLGLIPLYLKLMGGQEWGLVALCVAMQGILSLLDAGLSQVMLREIARLADAPTAQRGQALGLYARVYAGLGILAGCLGQLAVPWLLNQGPEGALEASSHAEWVLRLALLQFSFQFANSAYIGYWNGMQEQRLANQRMVFFGTSRHGCALALLLFWRPDALAYLWGFTLVSALEFFGNRKRVFNTLGMRRPMAIRGSELMRLGREVGVLAAGVLVGMLLTQIDRIVLVTKVDLVDFGHYMIVANFGLVFLQLQYPLTRAFFPRIAQAGDEQKALGQLTWSLLLIVVLPCLVVMLGAPWILLLWLGDAHLSAVGTLPLRLILLAVILYALYQPIYQRMLARGAGRLVLGVNVLTLVVAWPLTVHLAETDGIVAGGAAWVMVAAVSLLCGIAWLIWDRQRVARMAKSQ